MNALAAWGFRTPEAFERHLSPEPQKVERMKVCAKGRYVSQEELAAYAATLDCLPSHAEIWRHFKSSRTAAHNYRRKIMQIMARRGVTE